jgi:hypothetical protein
MARRNKKATADDQITEGTSYGPPAAGSVKSAGRVLQILEFFDEIQRDARVAEVAERLGFPQSSTSILLNCLIELGYMDYLQESRSFLPSPRVTLLGTWLDKGPQERQPDEDARRAVPENGRHRIIAARSGIFAQYVHVLQARAAMRFHVPPGSRRLVVWSATGFSLLTASSDKEIRSLCHRSRDDLAAGVGPERVGHYGFRQRQREGMICGSADQVCRNVRGKPRPPSFPALAPTAGRHLQPRAMAHQANALRQPRTEPSCRCAARRGDRPVRAQWRTCLPWRSPRQRRPRPRAIIPRRISGVPPRMVNDGACSNTCAIACE